MSIDALMARVTAALVARRYRFATEADLQRGIGEVLRAAGEEVTPEVQLSARDRIDFLVAPGLGIEVKVQGTDEAAHMQLMRYAEHPQLEGLVLVTGTARLGNIPSTIEGKPVRVVVVQRVLF